MVAIEIVVNILISNDKSRNKPRILNLEFLIQNLKPQIFGSESSGTKLIEDGLS